ncbi:MAG TPA: hypothetical protein DC014_01000 [Treponema sp.]|nr:hypothetical protein [Treponema sp.]
MSSSCNKKGKNRTVKEKSAGTHKVSSRYNKEGKNRTVKEKSAGTHKESSRYNKKKKKLFVQIKDRCLLNRQHKRENFFSCNEKKFSMQ